MEAVQSSEVLRQEVEKQSQSEAAEILKQTEKEAQTLIKQAEAEVVKIRTEIMAKAEKQAEQIRKRILSGVHLEIKKMQLRNRETLLDEILLHVREKLDAFRSKPEYKSVLVQFILEGMNAIESDEVILVCGSKEAELLDDMTVKEILSQMEKETGRTIHAQIEKANEQDGGVLILSADRRIRFDNRFSARLRRMDQAIRLEAMQTVFGVSS
ncbi:hypothetical protein HQ585_05275 [candidate division KSB1 bacterium]|nr:hypothetical protein [candidate division KSB1 bacterium]